jgi:protein-disulfide isomerase-like protein with CxxC motif
MAAFAGALEAPATRRAMALEWAQTAELGVTGYPTLLALQAGRPHVVSIGWRPYAQVAAAIQRLATSG